MIKLKPCPFCGGTAELSVFANPRNFCSVRCTTRSCGGETSGYDLCRTKNTLAENSAIVTDAWNRREGQ